MIFQIKICLLQKLWKRNCMDFIRTSKRSFGAMYEPSHQMDGWGPSARIHAACSQWGEHSRRLILLNLLLLSYSTPRVPNSCSSSSSVRPSQKASSGDISGTERGIIYPLVSKRPKKFRKNQKQKINNIFTQMANFQNIKKNAFF